MAQGRFLFIAIIVGASALLLLRDVVAQIPGRVDPSFMPSLGSRGKSRALARQIGGKILIGGSFSKSVARLNSDGTIDRSFDTGRGATTGAGTPANIYSMMASADGTRIYVSGAFTSFDGVVRNKIVALDANGAVIPTFDPGAGPNGDVYALAPLSDGRLVIGGTFTAVSGVTKRGLAVLDSAGQLDQTFNAGGVGLEPQGFMEPARSVFVIRPQSDGKILIAGFFQTFNGTARTSVARLLANGNLDTTFVPPTLGAPPESWSGRPPPSIPDLAVKSDGEIVVVGDITVFTATGAGPSNVLRLRADGSAAGGSNFNLGGFPGLSSVAVDSSDRIFVGGSFVGVVVGGGSANNLVRLDPGGTLDLSFQPIGMGGVSSLLALGDQMMAISDGSAVRLSLDGERDLSFVADPTSGFDAAVNAFITRGDGKMVAVGEFSSINGLSRTGVARLFADGSLDSSFDPRDGAGVVGYEPSRSVNAICAGPNDTVIIGGAFVTFDRTISSKIARLQSDGSLDQTFAHGRDQFGGGGFTGEMESIATYADGRIVVAGSSFSHTSSQQAGSVSRRGIIRLAADGTLDTSFNANLSFPDYVKSVVVQKVSGVEKVVIVGDVAAATGVANAKVMRLQENGSRDVTFPAGTADGSPSSLGVASDGKLFVGGNFNTFSGNTRHRVVRLLAGGGVDSTFNPGTVLDALGSITLGSINSDGTVLVRGYSSSVEQTRIVRLRANGTIDPAFNSNLVANAYVSAAGAQSDGTILITGRFATVNDIDRPFAARLLSDGTIDKSFVAGPGTPSVYSVLFDSATENVVVGGDFTSAAGLPRPALARLRRDGTLDPAFRPEYDAGDSVRTAVRRGDGTVIAASQEGTPAPRPGERKENAIGPKSRIGGPLADSRVKNPIRPCSVFNGAFDLNFNNGHPEEAGTNGLTYALALQGAAQRILVGGVFSELNKVGGFSNLGCLKADGTLDNTFKPTANLPVRALVVQPADDKCIVAGEFTQINGTSVNRIARLQADGAIDGAFNVGSGANGTVTALALQNDGKVMLGGEFTSVQGSSRTRLARLTSTGGLDNSFIANVARNSGAPSIGSIVYQPQDGKLIVAGLFDSIGGVARHNVVRLNPDGSVDTSFDPLGGPDDLVRALALQTDRKPLLGGDFTQVDTFARTGAARLFGDSTALAAKYGNAGRIPIPDNDPVGADSTVNVSGIGGRILKVTVSVYITHASDSDLTLRLIGPDGTAVDLSRGRGGNGHNFGTNCPADTNDAVFDDAAPFAIASGTAPFVGSFRPDTALTAFNGKTGPALNGVWKLRVIDNAAVGVGYIECWALQLFSTPAIAAFSPSSALPGASVTLSGNALTDTTAVQFNGAPTAFTVDSDGQITATVPAAASSGFITVATPLGVGGSLKTFTVLTDSDHDGMSDEFEQQYFGNGTAGDPATDADGDGETNLEEYRAGTSPLDANKVLRVSQILRDGNDVVIVFPAVKDRRYAVQAAIGIGQQFTVPIATTPRAQSDGSLQVSDVGAATSGPRFYRVVVLP